jgi:hypothetical protein
VRMMLVRLTAAVAANWKGGRLTGQLVQMMPVRLTAAVAVNWKVDRTDGVDDASDVDRGTGC